MLTICTEQNLNRFLIGRSSNNIEIICGKSGVGKTFLAAKYEQYNRENYNCTGFINSTSEITFLKDYLTLGEKLYLADLSSRESNLVAIKRKLSSMNSWLLTLDNVLNPDALNLYLQYLPLNFQGHIIVTSPHKNWSNLAKTHVIFLKPWKEDKSREFLGNNLKQEALFQESLLNNLAVHSQGIPPVLTSTVAIANVQKDANQYFSSLLKSYKQGQRLSALVDRILQELPIKNKKGNQSLATSNNFLFYSLFTILINSK